MNAKEEMLELLRGREIKCAEIIFDEDMFEGKENKHIILKVGHNEEEYSKFLNDLDFEYNNGIGEQKLYGTVWFKDNTWADHYEYDSSEWWKVYSLPDIPMYLV